MDTNILLWIMAVLTPGIVVGFTVDPLRRRRHAVARRRAWIGLGMAVVFLGALLARGSERARAGLSLLKNFGEIMNAGSGFVGLGMMVQVLWMAGAGVALGVIRRRERGKAPVESGR